MMRVRRVAALAAVLTLAPAGSANAAASPARCTHKGSKTVTQNRYARLYTYEDEVTGELVLYACWRATGKRIFLDAQIDDPSEGEYFGKVRMNGAWVVWAHQSIDGTCKADCPPDRPIAHFAVRLRDLRARRTRDIGGPHAGPILVTRTGVAAWLAPAGPVYELRTVNRSDSRVLDSGDIAPASLRLRGYELSWLNAGQPMTASLR
jgi:hypothetical protein